MKKALEITPNLEPLFGTRDENLRLLEQNLHVRIDLRSDALHVEGSPEAIARFERVFADYEHLRRNGTLLCNGELHGMLKLVTADPAVTLRGLVESGKQRSAGIKRMVQPRSINQRRYFEAIEECDMVFGVGPAGTGKTYLAVAMAASALLGQEGEPHHPGQTGGRSRRTPGLFARNAAGKSGSLSPSALRRAL